MLEGGVRDGFPPPARLLCPSTRQVLCLSKPPVLYSSWSLLLCGQGGGGGQLLISLRCALGGGRSVPAKTITPLANTLEHDTPLLCQAGDNPAVYKHDKGYCVKAMDRLLSQSTRHMLSQTNRHTAVIKARGTCCVRASDTLLCQTTRHTTVSKHDAGAVTHTAAVKHYCSVTAQHTKP